MVRAKAQVGGNVSRSTLANNASGYKHLRATQAAEEILLWEAYVQLVDQLLLADI